MHCHICGDPLTEDASATCNQCHRPFHLRLRNDDTTGKDCGDVWIDENYLSLEFACNEVVPRLARACSDGANPTR